MAEPEPANPSDSLTLAATAHSGFGSPRTRRTLGNGAAALLSRMIGVGAVVATVALGSRTLTRPDFGVWLALTTAFTLLLTLGVGAGGAIISGVANALGSGDRRSLRADVSSALAGMTVAGGILLMLAPVAGAVVPWTSMLGGTARLSAAQVNLSAAITIAAGAAIIPLSLAGAVYVGLQRTWLSAGCTTIGALIQVALVTAGAVDHWGLPALTLAFVLGPIAGNAVATALLLLSPATRPAYGDLSWARLRKLSATSSQFFLLTFIGVVAYQSDVFIVAHYLGASAVADYGVPFRMFNLAFVVASVFLLPLWPAYGEAWAVGDRRWVGRAFLHSIMWTGLLTTFLSVAIAAFARPIVSHWVASVKAPGDVFLLSLALYVPVMSLSTALSMLMNALHDVTPQLLWGSAMAVANVALSIALLHRFGVAAPVMATVMAQSALVLLPLGIRVRRRVGPERASSRWTLRRSPSM